MKLLTTLAISIPISSMAKVWLITTRVLYLFVVCSRFAAAAPYRVIPLKPYNKILKYKAKQHVLATLYTALYCPHLAAISDWTRLDRFRQIGPIEEGKLSYSVVYSVG